MKVERSLLDMLPQHGGDQLTVGVLDVHDTCIDGLIPQGADIPSQVRGPKALVWITHDASQAKRVGTRTLDITRES